MENLLFSIFILPTFAMMKQEIYKKSFEKYESIVYKNTSPINLNSTTKEEDFMLTNYPTKKHPLFTLDKTFTDDKTYIENYGNPMYSVTKHYVMVVVEKNEDKVSLKVFRGSKNRRAGNSWFKFSKNVDYVSVNTKTGDVYFGYIHEYQKKKCNKRIRRNVFFNDPLSMLKATLKNSISCFSDDSFNEVMNAFSSFMFEIDKRINFEELNFSQRLFRFYLNKRGIKYPNNFGIYANILVGPEIRKILKKQDNRLINAFMCHQNISGKKLKKALHTCSGLNIQLYNSAIKLFGKNWINQEDDIILSLLNSKISIQLIPEEFTEILSTEELKRVFSLFKQVFVHENLDSFSFYDHIRMYTELKVFGEDDLKWYSVDSKEDFRKEHLDWSDKLQYYKNGVYTRIYPEYMCKLISKPIDTYFPVLLNDTSSYNEESSIQSNCVKTYIGKCGTIIISLRKDSINSNERATIEYRLIKNDNKVILERYQTLGKYNSRLDEQWNDVLFKLDKQVLSCINDKRFETVKIIKECKNGVTLTSDSYWVENNLIWKYKNIDNNSSFAVEINF